MVIDSRQYIGSICHSNRLGVISGAGFLSGNGVFTGQGEVKGYGAFAGYGYFEGLGRFTSFNEWCSGICPGNDDDPSLPFITYSGAGFITGSSVQQWTQPNGRFFGRGLFSNTGYFSGNYGMDNSFSGFGWFAGSGYYKLNGLFQTSGNFTGNSIVTGRGTLVKLQFAPANTPCSVGPTRYSVEGDFEGEGSFTGIGTYKAFGYNAPVLGSGLFTVDGAFSGTSSGPFYGYGRFQGPTIDYSGGAFNAAQDDIFYGKGNFNGTGWLRSANGTYQGLGSAKGVGTFRGGDGSYQTLEHAHNRISGNGNVIGRGIVFALGPTGITGIYCLSPEVPIVPETRSRLTGCGSFGPYMTQCNEVGDLRIEFTYSGPCLD